MDNKGTNPVLIFASAMTVVVAGSFLLVVHIGVSGREAQGIRPYSNFSGEPTTAAAVSSYLGDFERGTEIIKDKSGRFMSGFFGEPARTGNAAGVETAQRDSPMEEDESSYSYNGKFEEENYSGSGGDTGNNFWANLGGGDSAAGGGGGGGDSSLSGALRNEAAGKNSTEAFGDAPPAEGKKGRWKGSRGIFGGPATSDEHAAAPKLSASLSGKNTPQKAGQGSGDRSGTGGDSGVSGDQKFPKGSGGGGLSGMPGQKTGASLDGAAENMKAAAASDYKAKMSGGAASVAAGGGSSGGGSSGGGSSGSGSAGGTVGAPEKVSTSTGTKTGDSKKNGSEEGMEEYWTYDRADNGTDLLAAVVKEKLNGTDANYVQRLEASDAPDEKLEKLLKPDGMDYDPDEKEFSIPDPEDLDKLSEERKIELKKELHTFIAKVENKHGKMTDLYRTSCTLTPDVCKASGITGSYLTMTTQNGATLVFGLKYVDRKWRLYTMDFKTPE